MISPLRSSEVSRGRFVSSSVGFFRVYGSQSFVLTKRLDPNFRISMLALLSWLLPRMRYREDEKNVDLPRVLSESTTNADWMATGTPPNPWRKDSTSCPFW